jgi:hypothetical protein
MLKDDTSELDYYALIKKAKRMQGGTGQKVKSLCWQMFRHSTSYPC